MAGRQRTFELVPTTLAKPHGDQPTRMTSKQIKKAYQQANRGPRVSRAEQRRLDAEELDRQKKEYERERAAAKAKAAREKKAAKENAEKEARRKMGLPEPSRFVRASQPTISTFIRNGVTGKRSWQQMEMETLGEDSNRTQSDTGVGEKDGAQPPAKRVATEDDSEDEFGDFPSLSQSDILEKIDSSMVSIKGGEAGSPAVVAKQTLQPPCQEPSQELPAKKSSKDEYPFDDSQLIAEMANTQLLSEAAEAAQRSDSAELPEIPLHKQGASEPIPPSKMDAYSTPDQIAGMSVKRPYQPECKTAAGGNSDGRLAIISRPHLRRPSGNMLPPPVPVKEKKAISFAPSPQKAKIPSQDISKRNNNPYNIPPSATQVFLENHLDDFFPSPTQEIRELLSDVDDLPSNTQVARELSPEAQKDIPDILPPKKMFARGPGPKPIIEEREFEDLISTQDLILSSQELLEITTPSRPPTKTNVEPEMAKEKPAGKPRPRFFEEKEDDILYAVLYESRTAAARAQTPAPGAKETKRTFFEEKEDDLLAAAIHESKMMAEMQGILGSPLKVVNGNERKKRTLKRGISSASTDYGEDGFSGDEWEFLGF
ncbi:hypothetical protein L207DRAFT_516577 [Hyaloscypha variabilis F]|uniref:Uncharacterized protein n=1 Tax=Hyaloscypha variabilis (strain UAMH 11265 / GT02V1 / F) TaxID=1149755 RepID=A0A2J6RAU3_HYAVF|nr:hypothetical protein L207DRAFT_516577 [Hyaloscypha variabilis F]